MRYSCFGTWIVLITTIIVLGCVAPDAPADDGKINVVVSILPLADFVDKIGGDKVDVAVMIPPRASPVTYEPTPSQLKSLTNANMYVKIGSGIPFETIWMDKIVDINKDILVVDCSKNVNLMESDHHHDSDDADMMENDPHIWLSLRNARIIAANIYNGLAEADPANRDYFLENKEKYLSELEILDNEIQIAFNNADKKTFIVLHPAWGYFARDYGLVQIPIEIDGKEPSSADVLRIIETAKANDIKTIFAQPQFNEKIAEIIAGEIGGEIANIDPLARDYIGNIRVVSRRISDSVKS